MAMTIRTIEDRFMSLLALHQLVYRIEENTQDELGFLADNPTLNTFMKDVKAYMENEKNILSQEIARQALGGEFTEFKGLMDSIVAMAKGELNDIK